MQKRTDQTKMVILRIGFCDSSFRDFAIAFNF